MMPVPLAYFSPIFGGLPGAADWGWSRPTTWMPSFRDPRPWLPSNTPRARPSSSPCSPARASTCAHRGVAATPGPDRSGPTRWFVLQNRPGAFSDPGRGARQPGPPRFTLSKLGVPLIWVFPYRELEEFAAELGH